MLSERTRHPRKQLLFTLLSLADFSLTWLLLTGIEGRAYEANPVAGWWLDRHGWAGLAGFKAGTVALVLALTFAVSRSRPQTAGRVLWLGCACLAVVTGYSIALYGAAVWSGDTAWQERQEVDRFNAETRAHRQRTGPFRALLLEVTTATREGRCTFLVAVERLAATELALDPAGLREMTPLDMDGPPARRLACVIAGNVLLQIREPEECERTFSRLDEEFRSAFGMPLPARLAHYGEAGVRRVPVVRDSRDESAAESAGRPWCARGFALASGAGRGSHNSCREQR